MDRQPLPLVRPMAGQAASAAAATVAMGAVACGVCCVLPFVLPAVILASTGSVLALVAGAFWWALHVATGLVMVAWAWVARDMWRTSRRPARQTVVWLVVATCALGVAATWPRFERRVIGWVQEMFR